MSSVDDYDLKGEDTVELTACKGYCHTVRVTVSSDIEFPPSRVTVLKLHSSNTFRTVEKLVLEGQRDFSASSIHACASGTVLEPERLVGTISECFVSIVIERARVVHHYASYSGSADRTSVMGVKRTRGSKTALSLQPSGSTVVYIDKDLHPVTFHLPDNVISILIIKELMKEILRADSKLCGDREVQLFQSGLKLADDMILSKCASTEIENQGSVILTYNFTSEYSKPYSVMGSTATTTVQVFSSDTVAQGCNRGSYRHSTTEPGFV